MTPRSFGADAGVESVFNSAPASASQRASSGKSKSAGDGKVTALVLTRATFALKTQIRSA